MKIVSRVLAVLLMAANQSCMTLAQEPLPMDRIYLGSWPSVSGDGSKFAFEWNDSIWIAPTAGGVAQCVTQGSSKDAFPVMAADGNRIVFNSNREGNDNHLFEIDVRTSQIRQLSYHSQMTQPYAWCPDGSNLLCTVLRDHAGRHATRLAILPTDRRADVNVLFDMAARCPSMSPDGTRVLFMRRGDMLYRKRPRSLGTPDAGEIWMYDLGSKEFTPLVQGREDAGFPIWAPDGKGFYYLRAVGGIRNLFYREMKDGAEPMQLTQFTDDHIMQPSISADGKTAVFRQQFDFYRLDLRKRRATPERIILHPTPGYQARPATRRRFFDSGWNSDETGDVTFCDNGMQIAFTSGGNLYVMDTVMREPRLVHGSTLTQERECVFSADGMTLYYTSDRGDGTDLWKAQRADPTKPWWENREFVKTRLTSDDEIRRNLTMSPDGKSLAWQGYTGRLAFADTNGVVRARGPQTISLGGYSWSPDGKYVAVDINRMNNQHDVVIASTEEDGKCWPLTRNYKYDGDPTWSPDGQVIAWTSVRTDIGDGNLLCYVYLDEALEERENKDTNLGKSRKTIASNATVKIEKKEGEEKKDDEKKDEKKVEDEKRPIPFEKLIDHVRVTKVSGVNPFFADDSRTVAFSAGRETKSVHIPDDLNPRRVFGCVGSPRRWTKKGNDAGKMMWMVNQCPAHGETVFKYNAYQTTDIADYQELAFRTAWGRIRDHFYDAGCHGVDWPAIREKYLPYARNAPSVSVFSRIMHMLFGELDGSHLGYSATDNSRREWERDTQFHSWQETTYHLGLRFDQTHTGKGWKIRDVIKNTPADRREYGFKPGDIVEKVNGVEVFGGSDPTEVLNGHRNMKMTVTVNGRDIRLDPVDYGTVRNQLAEDAIKACRERVHERSEGRFGYLDIAAMDYASLNRFLYEVYNEGYERDGLIIDVRTNHGGFTADRMMMTLFGAMHDLWSSRDVELEYNLGYSERPLWYKPIVVLCSEETGSNAEIFSHCIKQMKRGKLVGRETGGQVIATDQVPILDYGSMRNPHLGVFLLDGSDMEFNGAKPDFEVDNMPADIVKGVDSQLEKAIEVLGAEVENWKREHPTVELKYAR